MCKYKKNTERKAKIRSILFFYRRHICNVHTMLLVQKPVLFLINIVCGIFGWKNFSDFGLTFVLFLVSSIIRSFYWYTCVLCMLTVMVDDFSPSCVSVLSFKTIGLMIERSDNEALGSVQSSTSHSH